MFPICHCGRSGSGILSFLVEEGAYLQDVLRVLIWGGYNFQLMVHVVIQSVVACAHPEYNNLSG